MALRMFGIGGEACGCWTKMASVIGRFRPFFSQAQADSFIVQSGAQFCLAGLDRLLRPARAILSMLFRNRKKELPERGLGTRQSGPSILQFAHSTGERAHASVY
jgi:hypothetical protein